LLTNQKFRGGDVGKRKSLSKTGQKDFGWTMARKKKSTDRNNSLVFGKKTRRQNVAVKKGQGRCNNQKAHHFTSLRTAKVGQGIYKVQTDKSRVYDSSRDQEKRRRDENRQKKPNRRSFAKVQENFEEGHRKQNSLGERRLRKKGGEKRALRKDRQGERQEREGRIPPTVGETNLLKQQETQVPEKTLLIRRTGRGGGKSYSCRGKGSRKCGEKRGGLVRTCRGKWEKEVDRRVSCMGESANQTWETKTRDQNDKLRKCSAKG